MEEVTVSGATLAQRRAEMRSYLARASDQLAVAEANITKIREDVQRLTGAVLLLDELLVPAPPAPQGGS